MLVNTSRRRSMSLQMSVQAHLTKASMAKLEFSEIGRSDDK